MRALKLQIMPGQEVRGDVGIVWASDEAVCGRSCWADRSGSATTDPRCWGTFVWSAQGARRQYTVARAKRTITVDGKLNDWAGVPAMTFPPGDESARVCVQWSDQTIYLAYRVSDSPPLRNLGQDWTMLFKTGGCADFQLGALGSAGKPANPQRLLFSMFDGKPVAVLHRPNDGLPAPAGSKKWANVRYRSPVFDITFAAVYRLTKPQVAVIQTEDGYILEAAVPAEQLGLQLRAGLTIAGDAGLVVSNEAGSAVTRRVYWANSNTIIISDLPSEARLEPQYWGTLTLGE